MKLTRMPLSGRCFLIVTGAAIAMTTTAARAQNSSLPTPAVIGARSAIPFVPFTTTDLIDPATGTPYDAGAIVRFRDEEGRVLFEGARDAVLAELNASEKHYSALGRSLREGGTLSVHGYPTDAAALAQQVLTSLKLPSALASRVGAPVANCPNFTLASLGVNPKTSRVFLASDVPVLPEGSELTAGAFIKRINEQQKVLCSLGFDLLGAGGTDLGLTGLLARRDAVLADLGISRFHATFALQELMESKSLSEVGEEISKAIENKEIPGPSRIFDLARENGVSLPVPPELSIPDLPDIPMPVPPKRKELALKKRKVWNGLDEGDRDLVNIYANAVFEIRGDERQESADVEGRAGTFLLGKQIELLYGFASFYAGPDKVKGEMELKALGQDLFPPKRFEERVSYTFGDPKALSYDFDESISQTVMVGPIPITVTAGARAGVYLGYEVGLGATLLRASVVPGARADAYARGGVNLFIVSAGVGCELLLLNVSPSLGGDAGVNFDAEGLPFLHLGLNSDLNYSALDGRFYAYAEYPVPRFGLPPWKMTRSDLDIFSWRGFHESYRIMNWAMDISHKGVFMKGDLLDQTDREEAASVQSAITLEQRKQALAEMERNVHAKERATFEAIVTDLRSDAQARLPGLVATLDEAQRAASTQKDAYRAELIRFTAGE